MKINLKTTDREEIGKAFLKYGYSVATRKGFKGDSLDDAAMGFAQGAWVAYTQLDPEKANGGDGSTYVFRGGMNGLISATRIMTENAPRVDTSEEHSKATARGRKVQGDYAPADCGDEGEGATLWDMLPNTKAENPTARMDRAEMRGQLLAGLANLDERSCAVVMACACGLTYRAIGESLGLTHEAVRKIESKAKDGLLAS